MQQQNIKIAVDAIVFGYEKSQLYVLLIKQKFGAFKNTWSLPGGFVLNGEGLETAVERELREEAGITVNYLEQLYTFGDQVERDPRGQVISVAYFALVNPENLILQADTDAEDAQWFPFDDLPMLAYDHKDIIQKAITRLQAKLHYQPIGFDLLREEFPFSDLEQLYQTILGKEIERRNFRKKMLKLGIVTETGKFQKIGSGRPAQIYRFNLQKYRQLEELGVPIELGLRNLYTKKLDS
ncbi:MAG: NUDIX domain-containing protein [Bacteroidota bacterium]